MKECFWMQIPVGWAGITAEDEMITGLTMQKYMPKMIPAQEKPSQFMQKAICQVEEYFAGKRKVFDLPIRLEGTEFQKKVWNTMRKIPYGQVRSYGDIAFLIGMPRAARAVGGACHRNPIWLIVPCHRVIREDMSLGGYGGSPEVKRFLLKMEGASFRE